MAEAAVEEVAEEEAVMVVVFVSLRSGCDGVAFVAVAKNDK